MEKTFYVNVLFGKNSSIIYKKLLETIAPTKEYRLQIHPFRTSPVSLATNRVNIQHHQAIMDEILASSITNKNPMSNLIFVNYNTKELEPALKYDRIKFYLCDFIDESNIELVTLVAPIYINFLGKMDNKAINTYFMNYSILTFYDTDADRRVRQATTLDIGDETPDDLAFILETTHITNDNGGIILPYHPFRYSLFVSTQNAKDNISAARLQNRHHLIYYPFGQNEWLLILRNIMYEHVFLNFFVQPTLYKEVVKVRDGMYRNLAASNYKLFKRIEKKYKLAVLNEAVFDYKSALKTRGISPDWYNMQTRFQWLNPLFVTDVQCLRLDNGIFI